jgi:murein DD-endopeptidase MepM/ murein hydrolase activator NlpD
VCIQETLRLTELEFAGGYTVDPQFTPLDDSDDDETDESKPADVPSSEDTEPDVESGAQPTVLDFLNTNPSKGEYFKGVEYSGTFGSSRAAGPHGGIDLAAGVGRPIYAALGGTVTHAGKDTRSNIDASLKVFQPDGNSGPNGIYVSIKHDDDTTTKYLHLNSVNVSVGETVTQGQQIGTLGNTGRSSGPHLHLHTYDSSDAVIDPITWMTGRPTATFPVQVDADE